MGFLLLFLYIFIVNSYVVLMDDDIDDKIKVIEYFLLKKKYKKYLIYLKNE